MTQRLITVKYSKDILDPTEVVLHQDTCSIYDYYNVERIPPSSKIIMIGLPMPTKPQPPPCVFPQLLSCSQPSCPLTASDPETRTCVPYRFNYPSSTVDLKELSNLLRRLRVLMDDIHVIPRRVHVRISRHGAVQRFESPPRPLGPEVLAPDASGAGGEAEEQAPDGRGDEGAKGAPVALVQAGLEEDEASARLCVAVVDGAEDEDAEDAAKAADDDLKAAPPVQTIVEAEDEHGDGGGGEEIGDEVDLEDGGGLEGDDDGGDDEEDDAEADEPDVETVAEEVVGGRGDHGALQGVEGGARQRHGHDEDDAHDPRREPLQQQEEGDAAVLRRVAGPGTRPRGDAARHADEGEDDEDGGAGHADADPEVAVRLGGEGAQPEVGEEEVIGEHRHGEDVQKLPPEEARLEEPRGLDEGGVDGGARADGDGRDDDEAEDHDALDVVGDEGDLEATEGCVRDGTQGQPGALRTRSWG